MLCLVWLYHLEKRDASYLFCKQCLVLGKVTLRFYFTESIRTHFIYLVFEVDTDQGEWLIKQLLI